MGVDNTSPTYFQRRSRSSLEEPEVHRSFLQRLRSYYRSPLRHCACSHKYAYDIKLLPLSRMQKLSMRKMSIWLFFAVTQLLRVYCLLLPLTCPLQPCSFCGYVALILALTGYSRHVANVIQSAHLSESLYRPYVRNNPRCCQTRRYMTLLPCNSPPDHLRYSIHKLFLSLSFCPPPYLCLSVCLFIQFWHIRCI